jgi:uncharacterized protein (DUF305 family)
LRRRRTSWPSMAAATTGVVSMAMATVIGPEADVELPVPPIDDTDDDDDGGGGGGDPWWHAPWRLVVLGLAVLFLGGSFGYFVSQRATTSHPRAGSVDVGFLQDMRYHHDQATQMALIYLQKPAAEQDPQLHIMAAEILLGQQLEAGAMVQLLHDYGQPDSNESGIGMTWMSMPFPVDQMPGMATPEQIAALKAATGIEADRQFALLMMNHHLGGIHMAEYAVDHVKEHAVKVLATSALASQQSDVNELRAVLARLGS